MLSDGVGSTHPAAVTLAGALVHAEDADILTLSVQANLQQRKDTQVRRDRTGAMIHPVTDLQGSSFETVGFFFLEGG